MKAISLACLVVLMAGGAAHADHKDWNKYFSGTWTFEDGSSLQDFKVVADGNAVVGTGKSAGGEESLWVMGWDPAEKTVIHEWFSATHGRAVYRIVDDKTLHGAGVFSSTTEVTKGTVTLTKKDETTYTVLWTEVITNGKRSDDIEILVKKE